MALAIVRDVCTACGDCEPVCPTKSIKPFKGVYMIEADTCTECEGEFDMAQCLDVCMEDDCIVLPDRSNHEKTGLVVEAGWFPARSK